MKLDVIVDAAFSGKPSVVESEFAKAMVAGTYPGQIILAAQRHAAFLHKTSLVVEGGTPAAMALDSGFPRLHFSRKAAAESALRNLEPAHELGFVTALVGDVHPAPLPPYVDHHAADVKALLRRF